MYQRSKSSWTSHIDFIILDILCLQIAYLIAYFVRFPNNGLPYTQFIYRNLIIVIIIIQLLFSLALDNLNGILKRGIVQEMISVVILTFSVVTTLTLYLFSIQTSEVFSRLLIGYTFLFYGILDVIFRCLWKRHVIYRLRKNGVREFRNNKVRTFFAITENSRSAEKIIETIEKEVFFPVELKGFVLLDEDEVQEIEGIPVIASLSDAPEFICREWIDEVILSLAERSERVDEFMSHCAEMGVAVHVVLDRYSLNRSKQFVESLGGYTVVTIAYNYIEMYQAVIKRLMDIIGGIVGSLIAIVIGLTVGPIIYINSPGPILFKQKRIGRNGKPFWVYKFRSMYIDAEDRKKSLMTENRVADGMMFKMDFDPRVIGNRILPDGTKKTGIGEFIRKTSLDEFPQFFNVLRGDMSLVGTRPPTLDEWAKYKYHHRARMAIKPGITGMWQVSGRSEITDFEEVVKLDTEYILNYRLLLDIKILFKTVVVLLQRKGAL